MAAASPVEVNPAPSLPKAFLAGMLAAAIALIGGSQAQEPAPGAGEGALAALRTLYRRPDGVPFPEANPPTPAKLALGKRLFSDPALSLNGAVACTTCHDPALGFTDGVPIGRGVAGKPLVRHTPHLWNLAWGAAFFWDGRARTLEEQVRGPIEDPLEMGENLSRLASKLARDRSYRKAFAEAFPEHPRIGSEQIAAALATHVRSLVSPKTRFDAWADGNEAALNAEEKAGFALFNGKAGCSNCHSGWAFTDRAFHDIGLASSDLGRGKVIDLPAADHAFQTPSLRELAWTAPYMHDGSLATLDAVLDHYDHGVVRRPSLSPDLKRVTLTEPERAALLAFLASLSSENPPVPAPLVAAGPAAAPAAREGTVISQKDKLFRPSAVRVHVGQRLTIVNDDVRTHNVRLDTGPQKFNSGAQEPGQSVTLPFARPGRYELYCGIHPAMRLDVSVER
ncbi:cytochrome c peroxidase [Bosea sp. NPDC003192]|uniref:cytochrome c peroxidase n=1 Tax=Bosea sp. NPDC003192 TaxID=3390551 RepID=UPI003D08767E